MLNIQMLEYAHIKRKKKRRAAHCLIRSNHEEEASMNKRYSTFKPILLFIGHIDTPKLLFGDLISAI
jgi:hypothetical protein